MSLVFTFGGAYTPPPANNILFTWYTYVEGEIRPVGSDTLSIGAMQGLTTFPRGTATALHDTGNALAEYVPLLAQHNMFEAVCEFVYFTPLGVDTFTSTPEWPVLFKSSDLTNPINISVTGDNLMGYTPISYVGRSVVLFGGCGFGFGDALLTQASYWEDEQMSIKPSIHTNGGDTLALGEVDIR